MGKEQVRKNNLGDGSKEESVLGAKGNGTAIWEEELVVLDTSKVDDRITNCTGKKGRLKRKISCKKLLQRKVFSNSRFT